MQQLLVPGDPPPFSVHNEQGKAPLLLLCDHASKAVPRALGDLGISQAELSRHIGWDIGGLDMAVALAEALDAPLVASGYSRLVIDCNRWPGGEGSTPEISDGTPVRRACDSPSHSRCASMIGSGISSGVSRQA